MQIKPVGWIALHRKIVSNWIWKDRIMRCRWLELLMLAEWDDGIIRYGKHKIPVKRGQIVVSKRSLMHFWNTNNRVVKEFLQALEDDNMITTEKVQGLTIITICNYDQYQNVQEDDAYDGSNESQNSDRGSQKRLQKRPPIKQDNNKINKQTLVGESAPTHEEVFEDFFSAQIAVETFCKNESIDLETCRMLAREVINDWVLRDETHPTMKDGREHLLNQLRIKIKVYRQQQKREQNVLEKQKNGTSQKVKGGISGGAGRETEPNPLAGAKHYTANISAGD